MGARNTIIVGCMAYKRGVGGASYIAQYMCNSIAVVRTMQVGGGNERMIGSSTKVLK